MVVFFILNVENKSFSEENEIYNILQCNTKRFKNFRKSGLFRRFFFYCTETSDSNFSEDTLTRHLLKLSDIEQQFQELTNKFEEINFKIDKLSSRISKNQADNQLRFQDLEKLDYQVSGHNLPS